MRLIKHLSPLFRYLKLLTSQRRYFKTFKEPRNRLQGIDSTSLCSLAGRYDNHIPTWFPAPIDYSKIPAQGSSTEVWTSAQWAMLRVLGRKPEQLHSEPCSGFWGGSLYYNCTVTHAQSSREEVCNISQWVMRRVLGRKPVLQLHSEPCSGV